MTGVQTCALPIWDFVYLHRQPNDTLDTPASRIILRVKSTHPTRVLELEGSDGRNIHEHSKNCAPCHLPNLDPAIVTSTWVPPADYPCRVCLRTDDGDQMLLCDRCNGGYHLFCLDPALTAVPTGLWFCPHCVTSPGP